MIRAQSGPSRPTAFRPSQTGRAEPALQHALLDGHQQVVLRGQSGDEVDVERLDEARVGDRDRDVVLGQQRGGLPGLGHPGAVPEDRHAAVALAQQLASADVDRHDLLGSGQRHAEALAARVAQRGRAVVEQRGAQHVAQHRLVARGHRDHVRQRAQVGDVEDPVVGRAVVADQAGAVHREDDVQALQADVVDDLVVGALQERRVDRRHRLAALEREARGEQDRLLLGDPDVEVVLGLGDLQQAEAGAGVHRGGDPDDATVAAHLLDHRLPEDRGVLRDGGAGDLAALLDGLDHGRHPVGDRAGLGGVPLLHALQAAVLRGGEPLALHGGDVDDHRALRLERRAQRPAQRVHVVAVDDPRVGPVELLPEQARRPERLERLLELRAEALGQRAQAAGQVGEALLHLLAGVPELGVQAHPRERPRERPDVRRDRHAVVVEHHDDRGAGAPGLVDRLERDPAGHRPVADDRDDLRVVEGALQPHPLLDPHRVADRGRGVAGTHDVVLGFRDRAERGEPAVLADRRELVAPAREDLVRVGLVADVPEDLVPRGVHERVQGDGELGGAEVRAEMAADLPHRVDDVLADLLGHEHELLVGERVEVLRAVDAVEDARHEVLRG
jgi:hypothetical protein